MHELSLAQSIVDACSERAAGARVFRVTLEVGTLTCVAPEALRFCYEAAVEGTALEGSTLEIVRIPGQSRCRDCGQDVELFDLTAGCGCGSLNLERPRGGDALNVRSMEIEENAVEETS